MITLSIAELHHRAKSRRAGYVEAVLSQASEVTARTYKLTPAAYETLRQAWGDESCRHRGELIGEVPCKTCGGKVKAKVFACAVHERCTLFTKPIEGAKACRSCEDRKATEA